jgi:tetratricopeptide (TPR) repeat protein
MGIPDGKTLDLGEGVLVEPTSGGDRLALWVPEGDDWERVATVARAEVVVEQGVGSIAATAVRARRRSKGVIGSLVGRVRGGSGDKELTLPTGATVERVGERRTDRLLAWAVADAPLDEDRLKALWPSAEAFRAIGRNLYMIRGVQARAAATAPPPEPEGSPRERAERALAAARASADRRAELTALTDLGIILANEDQAPAAVGLLEQALTIAGQLGDTARESDVLGHLGLAVLATGNPRRTMELFDRGLVLARAAGDRFAEKLALERLGVAFSYVPDHARSLGYFQEALAIARDIGDRAHEAALQWQAAAQLAELGRTAEAIAEAQSSIDLYAQLGRPQAKPLAEHLRRFRQGDAPSFAGVTVVTGATPSVTTPSTGPGLLKMAFTAAQAMAKFVGSGFQTTDPSLRARRLQACASCEHHTGLRCRVCGCFTDAKARLPHEDCPLGKWPR